MTTYVGAETVLIDRWLRSVLGTEDTPVTTLTNLGVTGVYDHVAKHDAVYPFVVFQNQSSLDVGGNGPGRWMVNTVYAVKVVGERDTFDDYAPIVSAFDPILVGVSVAFEDGHITATNREEQVRFVENHDGRQVRHIGGLFRIYAQGT